MNSRVSETKRRSDEACSFPHGFRCTVRYVTKFLAIIFSKGVSSG